MPTVRIDALIPASCARDVFARVGRFDRYPEFVETVRSVKLDHEGHDGTLRSQWEVVFRNGVLRWTEIDHFDAAALRIRFEQTEGDFDVFRGEWAVTALGADTGVSFSAEFDFGVPTMAPIVDPVAIRVLVESIERTLLGLFAGAVEFPGRSESLDSSPLDMAAD